MTDEVSGTSIDLDQFHVSRQTLIEYRQGASPRELVVEACRRDQPHLIEQVLEGMQEKTNGEVAEFFNGATDALGNHALHICAMYGSCK